MGAGWFKVFWQNLNFFGHDSFTFINLLGAIIKIIIIFIFVRVFIYIFNKFITRVFDTKTNLKLKIKERQANTLKTLLHSLVRYVFYFIGIIMVLQVFGVKTDSLLAGAGILGLAFSFGAQNLVQDVITGFFLIFEDQFSVGEYVKIADVSGIVEETGLRVTKIRDFGGELHIIPNGLIKQVTNYSRGSLRALVEVGIAYEEDIEKAIKVMEEVSRELAAERREIVEPPIVHGVTGFGESEIVIRVTARTEPMAKWAIENELRKRIKEAFDREKIKIPYPRRVMINPFPKKKGEEREQEQTL
ncbi:MAG TPA: mechanosensitive ion channel family protein [Clostridia bacterium]|nr:mechanosensitive ion channel family protein [Clostridia bacterium]